jgi:hypothetical protein
MKSALVVFVLVMICANNACGQDDARGSDYYWRRMGVPCVNSFWGDVQWGKMYSIRVTTEVSPSTSNTHGDEYPHFAPTKCFRAFGMNVESWTTFDSDPAKSYVHGDVFLNGLTEGAFNSPTFEQPFATHGRLTDDLWKQSCQRSGVIGCFGCLSKEESNDVPTKHVGVAGLRIGMRINDALRILSRESAVQLPISVREVDFVELHHFVLRGRVLTLTGRRGSRLERVRVLRKTVTDCCESENSSIR